MISTRKYYSDIGHKKQMNFLLKILLNITQSTALRKNTTLTFVMQILSALTQLLIIILIAWKLGPEGNGFYTMSILLPSILVTFLNIGVGPATVYYISNGTVSGRQAVRENLILAIQISAAGLLIGVAVIWFWSDSIFPGIPLALLLIGILSFPIALVNSYIVTVLQGVQDFRAYNYSVVTAPIVTLVMVFITVYLMELGINGAVVSYLAGQIAGLVAVCIFIRKVIFYSGNTEKDHITDYKRKVLGFGWKAHLSNIMAFVNYRADIFLVNIFINPVATGIYFIAVQVAEGLWLFSHAVSTVLFPKLSSMHNDPVKRGGLTRHSAVIVGVTTIFSAILLTIFFFYILIPILGEKYKEAFLPYLWLLPGVLAGAISRIYSNCIAAAGRPEWNLYTSILVVIINVIGNVVLIPVFGIEGAAIATTIAYIINFLIRLYLVHRLPHDSPQVSFN